MSAAIESPSGAVRQANADLAGALLFFAIVLMTWISLAPFQDRSAADLAGIAETGSLVSQLVYSLAFVLVAAFVIVNEPKVLASLLNPVYVATLLWMLVCAALSDQPLLSLRRTLLLLIVIGISAMLMALPRSMRQFADLIGTATLVALVVCYLGLALVPWLAIHQASDAVEPGHAGAWRGLFDHKNEAGASMVLFLFIGLFIIRAGSQAMGWSIAVLSVVFLAFTAAKTPFALLLPVLAAAEVFIRTRSRALRLALTFGVVGLLNAFTVGGQLSGACAESHNRRNAGPDLYGPHGSVALCAGQHSCAASRWPRVWCLLENPRACGKGAASLHFGRQWRQLGRRAWY